MRRQDEEENEGAENKTLGGDLTVTGSCGLELSEVVASPRNVLIQRIFR